MARRSETRRRHGRHRSFERENRRAGYAQAKNLQFAGIGNGTLTGLGVDDAAPVAESWTIALTAATTFTATGTVSGLQVATGTVGVAYSSDSGEVSFLVTAGGVAFVAADAFTFDVDVNVGYQAALQPSRAATFVNDQDTRLTPNEGRKGIHDAMHLVQGDAESFSSDDVASATTPADIGLT